MGTVGKHLSPCDNLQLILHSKFQKELLIPSLKLQDGHGNE